MSSTRNVQHQRCNSQQLGNYQFPAGCTPDDQAGPDVRERRSFPGNAPQLAVFPRSAERCRSSYVDICAADQHNGNSEMAVMENVNSVIRPTVAFV